MTPSMCCRHCGTTNGYRRTNSEQWWCNTCDRGTRIPPWVFHRLDTGKESGSAPVEGPARAPEITACPKNGRHVLPDGAQGMITGDENNIAEALAAAYEGCEPCKADLERRVTFDDGTLTVLITAVWLCSYAQVRASQGLPPADAADELFPPVVLKELDAKTRRLLRRLVLEPVEAPGGRSAAQPEPHELADLVINVASDEERAALWRDALDGAVSIVMMEASRL